MAVVKPYLEAIMQLRSLVMALVKAKLLLRLATFLVVHFNYLFQRERKKYLTFPDSTEIDD